MKNKSLTMRISKVVTIMTLFVLLATLLTIYITDFNTHMKEAAEKTKYKLDLEVERFKKVQTSVENSAKFSLLALKPCMDDTLAVKNILNCIVDSNTYVSCAALAYAPNRLKSYKYYIPTAVLYGDANHYFSDKELDGEYIYDDWYIVPSLDGKPFWTAPYYNLLDVPVVSYAIPLISEERGLEGVLTLAVELTNLQKLLSKGEGEAADSGHQDKNVNVILDRNTTYLTSNHPEYAMNETLFTLAESKNDTAYSYVGHEILAGRDGEVSATVDGERCVISWRVLPQLDWTAMVITPYSDVYASVKMLTYTTFFVALLAAIAAIVILYFSVRRALRPFKRLKAATKLMSEGNYDVQLPASLTKRADEIGDLGREFMLMQKAVKKNINELEEEHKKLQHSNELLSTLMHNAIGHLQLPINDLLNYNDALATMANSGEEAQIIKSEAKEAGISILQHFNRLNELSKLISTKAEDDDTMIVIPSDDFVEYAMKGAHQLEKRFFLTIHEAFKDQRKINIRSNSYVLESLLYELIVEAAKVSNTNVVRLHFKLNEDQSALRILIEAKTDKLIPEKDKPNFFKRFAEEKVNAYATNELLPLYICYITSERLGVRLYVEPKRSEDDDCNIFVLEIPKAE